MRLFIAVRLPPELTDRAAALLPAALPAVRPVRPELMHVTLAFLGWTPDERLDAVIEAARVAAAEHRPFDLRFAGAGRFPAAGRPTTVWLGIADGRDTLVALAESVVTALRRSGLAFDDRPFAPHLTLARVRREASAAEGRTVAAAAAALEVPAGLRAQVDRIAVMESVLSPKGPRYTARAEPPLATGASPRARGGSGRRSSPTPRR